MELISVLFPPGPVKVCDFFSVLFFFLNIPPTFALLSSIIMVAYQELRHNQLVENPWLPFEGRDYDGGKWLKLLSRNQVEPLVFHCCPVRCSSLTSVLCFWITLLFISLAKKRTFSLNQCMKYMFFLCCICSLKIIYLRSCYSEDFTCFLDCILRDNCNLMLQIVVKRLL